MYPSKFLQENPIISKALKEISITKFPEIMVSFTTNLERVCYYEHELNFESKDITQFFLNTEFSLLQFVIEADEKQADYDTIKKLIKAVFYNNQKLRAFIQYYVSRTDSYNDFEPVIEDEDIEIYISEDSKFILNIRLLNKDILKYIR